MTNDKKPLKIYIEKSIDELPRIKDGKASPVYVKILKHGYEGKQWEAKAVAFYFPEHFKTVEWEDWDDYSQADFPYTEEDTQKGIVWLRPGWYEMVNCDQCYDNGYWSSPLDVIEWYQEITPSQLVELCPEIVEKYRREGFRAARQQDGFKEGMWNTYPTEKDYIDSFNKQKP